MKKKFFLGAVAVAIVLVSGWNILFSQSNSDVTLPDVVLANVEALAQGESGGTASCTCTKKCNDNTTASCTGYNHCNCHPGSWFVECDGVTAYC